MTPSEKHKAIAIAYSIWATIQPYHVFMNQDECFKAWLLTEEGKRLTAEEPAINVLIKISKQLDRIEGSMKFEPKE